MVMRKQLYYIEQDVKINDYIEEFSFEKWKELQKAFRRMMM